MKWCIETSDGCLHEVLYLFDSCGDRTDSLIAAEAMVVRVPEDQLLSAEAPYGGVHRIQ